ncbi:MAG TPA: DNA polymerase ligase N-terminal domain-containing protein [Gemmataceae bacterium]|jgi:hypothetical protein|nr:DNA polymerase ligase N-terminal domain-containing protein [Gemmataceae bacterium]
MSRYVILEHDHPERHWDLMLESGEVLRTWRLAAPPCPGHVVPAEASFDHRRLYLDYEGPVSGDRGRVARWDAGSVTWLADESECVLLRLVGERCRGTAELRRTAPDKWSLTFTENPGQ